jgi:hypothetical protein
MLLETLDLRTNDVLIYSQNMFNFNNSFKIVYKNEKIKRPRSISYFDVCSYIKNSSPKNLIIYRLLTNVNSLGANSTKYGYFININGKVELIYFDPIFAIKDLRHLRFNFDPNRFRFKIQQVGLTSLTKREAEASFAEVYSFDLKAIEAQHQNDKIFADAIFAFDPNYSDEDYDAAKIKAEEVEHVDSFLDRGSVKSFIADAKKISEDKGEVKTVMSTVAAPDNAKVQDLREEIIDLLKQALGIEGEKKDIKIERRKEPQIEPKNSAVLPKENLSGKLKPDIEKTNPVEKPLKDEQSTNVFDLFKTTNKSVEISEREKESIILKFD